MSLVLMFFVLAETRPAHRRRYLLLMYAAAGLGVLLGSGAGSQALWVVGTGLLGGFTTFSTASFESAALILDRRWGGAAGSAARSGWSARR